MRNGGSSAQRAQLDAGAWRHPIVEAPHAAKAKGAPIDPARYAAQIQHPDRRAASLD